MRYEALALKIVGSERSHFFEGLSIVFVECGKSTAVDMYLTQDSFRSFYRDHDL